MIDFIIYYRYFHIIVILILLFIVSIMGHKKYKKNIMYKKTFEFLEQSFKDYANYSLRENKIKEYGYDYHLTFKTMEYYIKLIRNYSNAEISVHGKYNWQSKSTPKNRSINQIKDINYLLDKEVKDNSNKKVCKLFIVYPDARRLLLHKGVCEITFIDLHTDVFGVNIITYSKLAKDATILDKTLIKRN